MAPARGSKRAPLTPEDQSPGWGCEGGARPLTPRLGPRARPGSRVHEERGTPAGRRYRASERLGTMQRPSDPRRASHQRAAPGGGTHRCHAPIASLTSRAACHGVRTSWRSRRRAERVSRTPAGALRPSGCGDPTRGRRRRGNRARGWRGMSAPDWARASMSRTRSSDPSSPPDHPPVTPSHPLGRGRACRGRRAGVARVPGGTRGYQGGGPHPGDRPPGHHPPGHPP